ncbi:MAG: hypothetical protein NTV88_00755 [Candidatus Micrarchaeota archaeon]|nr:hypothetical protein [Candidatus Micrarchaeota archaeon]
MPVVETLTSIENILLQIGPIVSVILIVLGGLAYGMAQTQPSDQRGKYITTAYALIAGGIVVAAITGAATFIASQSTTLITDKPATIVKP